MKIRSTPLTTALNEVFINDPISMTMILYGTGLSGVIPQSVSFSSATWNSTTKVASIITTSAITFSIPAGGVVTSLEIVDNLANVMLTEDVADKSYASAGTYTVNSVTIKINGGV